MAYTGRLGQWDLTEPGLELEELNLEERIRSSADEAAAFLRDQWDRFVGLYSSIIDLQHRAATAAYEARARGDLEGEEMARRILDALVSLQRQHDTAVRTMEGIADTVGLGAWGGEYTGLGAVPFAAAAAVSGLGLVVLWFFRAYAAEERKLELLEAGVLTPEQFDRIHAGPAPAMLGQAAGIAKLLLWGLALFLGYRVAQEAGLLKAAAKRLRRNPPLVVFESNPPGGRIGEEVMAVWYRHADDGLPYVHEFGPGVELYADDDGTVHLEHADGRELWADFEVLE